MTVLDATGQPVGDKYEYGPFVVPASESTLWLDELEEQTTTAGSVVARPTVYAVNGQDGEVTITAAGLGAYVKPNTGVPKTDLAAAVQTSLGKADDALPATEKGADDGVAELVDGKVPAAQTDMAAIAAAPELSAAIADGLAVFSLGDATENDTDRINTALTACRLAGGGVVYGKPGADYKIDDTLIIGAGTLLDLGASDLTLLPGSNCQMVTNYSDRVPVGTATDAAVTSGSAVVTTSLASVAAVGMTVYVDGAGSNGYGELIGLVGSVDTGAGTITLHKLHGTTIPAVASATVSGANIQLSNVDADVHIRIRNAKRGANGPDSGVARGSAIAGHSIFLRGVRQYSVEVQRATSTAGISFIWPTNASHGTVRLWDADVHRTGVQVVGPIFDLRLYARGRCTDDLVNLCGNVYRDQTNTSGDVVGVTIEDIVNSGTTNGSALKINPCQGNFVDGVVVEGRIGGVRNGGAASRITIMEDIVEEETTGGTCGSIDLGVIDFPASSSGVLGFGGVAIRSLKAHVIGRTVHPVRINPGDGNTTPPVIESVDLALDFTGDIGEGVQLLNYATIGTLKLRVKSFTPSADRSFLRMNSANARVRHLILDTPQITVGRATTVGLVRLTAGTVDRVSFIDPNIVWPVTTNGCVCVLLEGATVGGILFRDGEVALGDSVVRANSGAVSTVRFDGFRHNAGQRLLHSGLATVVHLDAARRIDCTQYALYPQSAAVALTIRGTGAESSGSNSTGNVLLNTNGAASVPYSLGIRGDASVFGKAAGAMMWNTNASLACGAGPVISDGTSWKNLYSGATYTP
ncbi:hypothetical protein IT882_04435 [Microbacterium schleiferi]|uniref:Uncharacterized protein n=1 Tax=Microbacterium schleiferi TaxID=69362 RepID=A0A7S8MY14_9MICO|nr:hypothetical protein [Microbacterium schleiferi]QPE05322.1 hypothetical protein IT882_04435 [Microbacterium schleiferi]